MATPKRNVQASHYGELYRTLLLTYQDSVSKILPGQVVNGINGHTSHALGAFMLTGSIWESLLNFAFFSGWTEFLFGPKAHLRISSLEDELEGLNLVEKTYAIPLIAFERSFDKGTLPFQDFVVMVSIRNCIVHDRPSRSPEKDIDYLRRKKLLLHDTPPTYPIDHQPWQQEISTLESIRWCNNLLNDMVEELIRISEHPAKNLLQFQRISPAMAREMMLKAK